MPQRPYLPFMRLTGLIFASLLLGFLPAVAGHSPPKVFLRVHIQTAGQGLPETQATTIELPPDGETIQIRAIPEVTERNLIDVKTEPDGGVRLFFNHQGSVALNVATGENQGRIMVVLINGYVAYAPVIDEQITDGQLVIPHRLNDLAISALQEVARENARQANKT
ncbi:MAG: hypothetical protein LV479_01850 [Methylacidiphilales bacterium]|nr:hypothetical protein [Candidatus Methylacidiphilales bacterium]